MESSLYSGLLLEIDYVSILLSSHAGTLINKQLAVVASEMKAFLPLGWEPEWDVKSIMEEGWIFDNRTIFKNVYKVAISCDLNSGLRANQIRDTSGSYSFIKRLWEH